MIVDITTSNSSVFAKVFSLKSIPYNSWVMRAFYSVGKEFGKGTQLFAKQKVSQVLCGLALLAKHSRT